MSKTSAINVTVNLDDQKHPKSIFWEAEDGSESKKEAKAMLLSFFDKEHLDTFKIDLWTNELQVAEMDRFMFQTLKALADTYYKATNNAKLANNFMGFAEYFGEETDIIPKSDNQ
jgi:gliding motility-associated protein GldC